MKTEEEKEDVKIYPCKLVKCLSSAMSFDSSSELASVE